HFSYFFVGGKGKEVLKEASAAIGGVPAKSVHGVIVTGPTGREAVVGWVVCGQWNVHVLGHIGVCAFGSRGIVDAVAVYIKSGHLRRWLKVSWQWWKSRRLRRRGRRCTRIRRWNFGQTIGVLITVILAVIYLFNQNVVCEHKQRVGETYMVTG